MNDKQNASNSVNAHPIFCPKCGYKNKEKAKYCASCGNKMPERRVNMSQSKTVKKQQLHNNAEDNSEVTQMLMPDNQQVFSKSAPVKQMPSHNTADKKEPAFQNVKQTAPQRMPQAPQKAAPRQMPRASQKKPQTSDEPIQRKREGKPNRQKAVFSDMKPVRTSSSKNNKAIFSSTDQKSTDISQTTVVRQEKKKAAFVTKASPNTQSPVFKTETLPDQSMFETKVIKEPVSIFAEGLPGWTVTPPKIPVRRKRRK